MMLRAAVLAIALTLSACSSLPWDDDYIRSMTTPEYFHYVCEALDAEKACEGIEYPVVVTSKILPFVYKGAYVPDEPQVFISPTAPDPAKTTVHEITHYVLYKTGLNTSPNFMYKCQHEEVARRVADQWAGDAYNDDWRFSYACTTAPPSDIEVREVK